jgi:hypothetical protein
MKTATSISSARHTQGRPRPFRLALACGSLLLMAAALWLSQAHAQTPAPPGAAVPATAPAAPLRVGDATYSLLEKQRAGTLASDTPRPIAGEVAQRSYERYLRSFERPIPESFTTVASPGAKTGK